LQDLRRKAARLVSAKCALAARVDASHESKDGTIGQMFREEIEKKLDKLSVQKFSSIFILFFNSFNFIGTTSSEIHQGSS